MATSQDQVVSVGGHRIKLTNLDKVLYPETGTTKGDVLAYYSVVADVMIPHVRNRPATRKRWVHGVGTVDAPGQMFFQKNLDDSTPDWVQRRSIQHKDHVNEYPLVNNLATLTWLAQIAALELHVPQWQFGRTGVQKNPDRLVLDLDPGPGTGLAECAEVARYARAILQDMDLDPLPVTSGSKGIHLYVALDGKQTSEQVSLVAHELARALEADHPDLVVSDMKKDLRSGRVLVDWSQNNENKTTIAPYSLRGRAHPTVAAPRTWRELASPSLAQLDYTEVLRRVERRGDPLADLQAASLATLEPTAERMAGFDRLEKYRSMRDGSKTPEPVPAEAAPHSDGQTFVIQEHHARRLHWDFRLEHEGVLVSWALPKGVPTDVATNHLAVQTEDHPLEYGSFEGSIPAGEYGAGEVTIWDAGTYELEKWRDGKEVIATLHGEKQGSHRYALIHTGRDNNNWLIHLMKEQTPGTPSEKEADAPAAESAAPVSRRKTVGSAPRRAKQLSPMLATLGTADDVTARGEDDHDPDEGWSFEMKWDGIRAIATVENGHVQLVSRNGIDMTASYPELAALAETVDGDAVLDGEIVALDRRGRPDFGRLQTRMKLTKKADVERAEEETPVHYFVFDVLAATATGTSGGAKSLTSQDYDTRRDVLNRIVTSRGAIQVPPAFDGDLDAAIASSKQLGLEGVMAKRRDSHYLPGKRSAAWLKVKHHRTQEVVVAGWRPGKGRRAGGVGSLLLGIPDTDGLRYVGRVGTGFSDRELDDLQRKFASLERKTSPMVDVPAADASDARWIRPSLVGEVEFAEWTATDRLRQPSWRGWRPDKAPDDVVREES
ncbi:ATP-dependent DNA ligase [Glaciihabitans sp. dw_435]|uniref:ATP-dependent DNA ligase n=1 Tax=Glaciihabitans sp. dw_435 TaxID=2720081 RepID=UPI001BD546A7|nr:ATP-dependent DNA ligase [Glaciihabitans sp. dw_435]